MRQTIAKIINNRRINRVIVFLRIERLFIIFYNPYKNFRADEKKKSVREISGFSHNEYIDRVLERIKFLLKETVATNFKGRIRILEIGCGPGNYIEDLQKEHKVAGIDINQSMLDIAKKRFPESEFIYGDFLKAKLQDKYDFIYCVGVLQYFYPSQIPALFAKISSLLNDQGVFFVNFPHALGQEDLRYPNLSYVQYSPELLRKAASGHFSIIFDLHTTDGRFIREYDETPHENPVDKGERTYLNSYTLIFKKNTV